MIYPLCVSHVRVKFVTILFMKWFITGTCARICLICFNRIMITRGRCQGVWWGVAICRSPTKVFWQRSCAKVTIWGRGILTMTNLLSLCWQAPNPPTPPPQKNEGGGGQRQNTRKKHKHTHKKGFMPNHWGGGGVNGPPLLPQSGAAPALPCKINEMLYAF